MLPDRPVEVGHTGLALSLHRENLGVTLLEVISAAGGEHEGELRKLEASRRLDPALIERHHKPLILAWQASNPRVNAVMGMREQWYTTPADWALWDAAKALRPTVAWGGGARRDVAPAGAWCYVCDAPIHRYDVSRGLTMRGRLTVMTHRYGHAITIETRTTTETEEKTA